MLPEFLFTSYKQYKTDTDKITTWLAETAKKCGYNNNNNSSSSGSNAPLDQNGNKPAKLKGRARKLARDAAAAVEKKGPQSPSSADASAGKAKETKQTVPVREFEVMAKHIARSRDKSLKVPRGFVNLMKRCIQTRRGTADWFEKNVPATAEEEVESTDRHLHFANVLQRTLQTLLPIAELRLGDRSAGMKSGEETAAAESTKSGLANAFSLLTVDETVDEDFDPLTSLVSAGSAPAPQRVRYVADTGEEDDGEEWFFALHLLFFDMHELRILLSVLWSVYKRGQIDLATVAVTTNTAYDLMRRAVDDFNTEMRIPKDYAGRYRDGDVVELYYIDACLRAGLELKRDNRRSIVDLERWGIVQESFQLPYRLLVTFKRGINELNSMPVTRPAALGTYTPGVDRAELDPEELCEQDGALLTDFLTTAGPYTLIADTPNDDELMRGIEGMLPRNKGGKIPLWLVCASQSFLDTHHILMKDADRPLHDLQEFSRKAQSTLKEHFDFVEEYSLSGLRTKKSESYVQDTFKEITEWGLEDKLTQIMDQTMSRDKQKRGRLGKEPRVWKPNELLKMHPLLCGMLKYSFHLQLQWEGVRLLNETGIMAVAHLYNALKQCRYLPDDCEWEDMNLLIQMHGPQDIFLGEFPTTMEDCTKRLALSQGVSPQTFARNRRRGGNRVIFSKSGGRDLKQASPIASIFRNRFLDHGDVDLSVTSVEVLLGRRLEARRKNLARVKDFLLRQTHKTEDRKKTKKIDLGFDEVEWPEKVRGKDGENGREPRSEAARHVSVDGSPEHEALQPVPEQKDDAKILAAGAGSRAPRDREEDGQDAASTACNDDDNDDDEEEEEGEEEDNREPDQSAIVRWQKHRQLSILDFLTELSEGLNDEDLDLQYDYFALFRRVWRLLEAIQAATMPILHDMLDEHTASMMATKDGVSMIPGVIMLMASDPRNAPNLVVLKDWVGADDRALRIAADVVRDFVQKGGEGSVEAERQDRVLRERRGRVEFDTETRKALDEIESIRVVLGAVQIEDGLEDQEREIAELARMLGLGGKATEEEEEEDDEE